MCQWDVLSPRWPVIVIAAPPGGDMWCVEDTDPRTCVVCQRSHWGWQPPDTAQAKQEEVGEMLKISHWWLLSSIFSRCFNRKQTIRSEKNGKARHVRGENRGKTHNLSNVMSTFLWKCDKISKPINQHARETYFHIKYPKVQDVRIINH